MQSKANTGVFFFSDIGDEDSGIQHEDQSLPLEEDEEAVEIKGPKKR